MEAFRPALKDKTLQGVYAVPHPLGCRSEEIGPDSSPTFHIAPTTMPTEVRFTTFPRTESPPDFVKTVVEVFAAHEPAIGTLDLEKGLTSDEVLAEVREDLRRVGFEVEGGKKSNQKISRPVFYGENGAPSLRYEIDAFHPVWRCGLEIEAGRAIMGNAVYRDLLQAMVMVQVDYLILAVPNAYKYRSQDKPTTSRDYKSSVDIADALFGHTRLRMPYRLAILGY